MKINNFPLKLFVWAHFLRYLLLCKGNAGDKLLLGRSVPFFFFGHMQPTGDSDLQNTKIRKIRKKESKLRVRVQNTKYKTRRKPVPEQVYLCCAAAAAAGLL